MNELIKLDGAKCQISKVAAEITPGLTREDWLAIGGAFNRAAASLNWWLGDWMAYGELAYGEQSKVAEQLSNELGMGFECVRGCAKVSRSVKVGTRVPSLSWSHHREVMSMDERTQKKWLAKAVENGWSVAEMRKSIRESQEVIKEPDVKPGFLPSEWALQWTRGIKQYNVDALNQEQRENLKASLITVQNEIQEFLERL